MERNLAHLLSLAHERADRWLVAEPAAAGLKDLVPLVALGASPRATLGLHLAARANALLNGRAYVTPQDVKEVAPDVLRHRVLVTYEAEAEDISSETVVARVLREIPVP